MDGRQRFVARVGLAAALVVAFGAVGAAQVTFEPSPEAKVRPERRTFVYDRATFATGASPVAVAAADLDGDGRGDFVTADGEGDSVTVLLGRTGGGLVPRDTIPVGNAPNALAIADLDGDGVPDVVVVNQNCAQGTCGIGSVAVLLGRGDGTFDAASFFETGTNPQSVAIDDFDGDRVPDLAVVNAVTIITPGPGTVSILRGLGDGSFAPAVDVPAGDGPLAIATADFDEDGARDLAIVNSIPFVVAHAVVTLRGHGDGTFDAPVAHETAFGPADVVAADLDLDGHTDLATANLGANSVSVLIGDGRGGFLPPAEHPAGLGPKSIAAADLDLDGLPDLALTAITASSGGGSLVVLRGEGGGLFAPREEYETGLIAPDVLADDVDDDGWPDLLAPTPSGRLAVHLNQGDGTLYEPEALATGGAPTAVATADFDHDGHTDLAVANAATNTFSVFPGAGGGVFGQRTDHAGGSQPSAIAVADMDGDGDEDVVLANAGSGRVTVRLGDGAGGFLPAHGFVAGSGPAALAVADFDGDGHPDVAVAATGANTVAVLLGDGDGTLQPKSDVPAGPNPVSLVAGDFDEDGILDLAVADQKAGPVGPGKVAFLAGQGDGTFARPLLFDAGVEADALARGDFNHDGHLDVAVATNIDVIGSVAILLGQGDGTFAPQVTYPTGRLSSALVVADFDEDQRKDLAVANTFNNTVTILRGLGDGTFELLAQQAPGPGPVALTAAHFDGDAVLDLAVVNSDATVGVFLSK